MYRRLGYFSIFSLPSPVQFILSLRVASTHFSTCYLPFLKKKMKENKNSLFLLKSFLLCSIYEKEKGDSPSPHLTVKY